MTDIQSRLTHCFSAVFPELSEEQIQHASIETVENWDSFAAVTLLAVVQEEFGVQIEDADLMALTSYARMLAYLQNRNAAA
ncbi:MAG TPA: acyl carrier protein [Chthonomonadaceae bacterium]|nr:acyl carrier protein [Chthonomonadaceae bacterium]